jgi:hypothetical protein
VFAAALQSILYDIGLCVVALYTNEVVCALVLKHFAVAVPDVVIVGIGLMVIVTANVAVILLAFLMVSVPE